MIITMTVDKHLRIIKTCEQWAKLSLGYENDILGRRLLEFIDGDPIRMYIQTLISKASVRKEPVSTEYRCDDHLAKRLYKLSVLPLESDYFDFKHELLWAEPHRLVPQKIDKKQTRLPKCSICCRFSLDNRWLEAEDLCVIKPSYDLQKFINAVCTDCTLNVLRRDGDEYTKG